MYAMNYDIRIGDYKIKTLDSVNIVKSVENLTDKATIVIPGTHINRSLEVEDMLKEGDVVAISLGYDNDLKTEFTGYLSGISTDDSTIKLICEDALYLFKKSLKDREIKSIRLKKLLSDIIDEINTINKTNGTITNYKLDCDFDFGYSKFVLYKATGLDALQKIQEETKANIYFEGETLHVHAVYSYIVNEQAVVFDFAKNIEKSDLKYMRAKDKKIEVEVKIVKPDGKITSEKFGNPGGIKTTRTVSAESASDLKKIAENEYNLWVYDGFEGGFTGWLIPYVEPAYKVELRDWEYPKKNGLYYVIGTEVNFSRSGGERKINLGRRLG